MNYICHHRLQCRASFWCLSLSVFIYRFMCKFAERTLFRECSPEPRLWLTECNIKCEQHSNTQIWKARMNMYIAYIWPVSAQHKNTIGWNGTYTHQQCTRIGKERANPTGIWMGKFNGNTKQKRNMEIGRGIKICESGGQCDHRTKQRKEYNEVKFHTKNVRQFLNCCRVVLLLFVYRLHVKRNSKKTFIWIMTMNKERRRDSGQIY